MLRMRSAPAPRRDGGHTSEPRNPSLSEVGSCLFEFECAILCSVDNALVRAHRRERAQGNTSPPSLGACRHVEGWGQGLVSHGGPRSASGFLLLSPSSSFSAAAVSVSVSNSSGAAAGTLNPSVGCNVCSKRLTSILAAWVRLPATNRDACKTATCVDPAR